MKVILYHGTSSKHLDSIQKNGIIPRKIKSKGNYQEGNKSHPYVYLTNLYPVFYSLNSLKRKKDMPVLIRVEVDLDDLYPDEDWLALQYQRKFQKEGGWESTLSLQEIGRSVDPKDYKEYAKASLDKMGNVCTDRVRPEQITHIVTLPTKDFMDLIAIGADTNYSAIASYNLTSLFNHYSDNLEILFENGWDHLNEILMDRYRKMQIYIEKLRNNELLTEEENEEFIKLSFGGK